MFDNFRLSQSEQPNFDYPQMRKITIRYQFKLNQRKHLQSTNRLHGLTSSNDMF